MGWRGGGGKVWVGDVPGYWGWGVRVGERGGGGRGVAARGREEGQVV